MDYDAALGWWYGRVDFERKPAGPNELKLDRMRELLDRLGNPQDRLRIVHVAGSKGKGSTAAMVATIARAAGQRVGLFTSPHLCNVQERVCIDGQPIDAKALAERLSHIRPAADALAQQGREPTFFEIATALGFSHFASEKVELAVIEVGLGGRFDATNVCRPVVSIITSISYDHTAILGDKLAQIAFEKCGIIKPGVPVVSGTSASEATEVVHSLAAERQSPLLQLGRDFHCQHRPGQVDPNGETHSARCTVLGYRHESSTFALRLLGAHQAANASLAVVTARLLDMPESAIAAGLATVKWPARMEVFPGQPLLVLDCAHNIASVEALVETLRESFPPGRRALIFAASSDKDVAGMLTTLLPHFDLAILTRFHNPARAIEAERLLAIAKEIGGTAKTVLSPTPEEALAIARGSDVSTVVIAGSVYLAGDLRQHLDVPYF